MDLQTDVNGFKHFLQMVKRALHGCMTRRDQEGRRPSQTPLASAAIPDPKLRARSVSLSPLLGVARAAPPPCQNEAEEEIAVLECQGKVEVDRDDGDESMTFQELPYECKLKIFSFLTAVERGAAERVCRDWRDVVRSPTLWTDIDLSLIGGSFRRKAPAKIGLDLSASPFSSAPPSPGPEDPHQDPSSEFKTGKGRAEAEQEYERYKARVSGYVDYLREIRPCVKTLSFSFDIGDSQDGWTQLVKSFLDSARTRNAESARLDWKDTPAKPSALTDGSSTWSTGNYSDLMYKQRRRQRLFVNLFDAFTALVPNLRRLTLPFDWSTSSVSHLTRLGPTLTRLGLEEYFVPQPLEQSLLDRLLAGLPNLEELSVGLVLGSGLGMSGYEIRSQSLVSLDLSGCQGFAVTRAELPELKRLKISNASFPSQLVVVQPVVEAAAAAAAAAADVRDASPSRRHARRSSEAERTQSGARGLKSSQSSPSLCPLQTDSQKLPVPSSIPCLFNVLKKGAPSLQWLNDHRLQADWKDTFDPKLETILHEACPCLYHHQYHRALPDN